MQFQIINVSETEKYKYWTEVRPELKVYYTLTAHKVITTLKFGEFKCGDVRHGTVYWTEAEAHAAIPRIAVQNKVPESYIEVIRHERQEYKLVRCRKAK